MNFAKLCFDAFAVCTFEVISSKKERSVFSDNFFSIWKVVLFKDEMKY
jgi:hypothetical protein